MNWVRILRRDTKTLLSPSSYDQSYIESCSKLLRFIPNFRDSINKPYNFEKILMQLQFLS